jgi:hypothetical protein
MKPNPKINTYDLRSPEAKARDEWLLSNEGLRCCVGVPQGQYLVQRLVVAFQAGVKWGQRNPKS